MLSLLLVCPAVAADRADQQEGSGGDTVRGFPPGEGRAYVLAHCLGCHSEKIIQQQGMSRKRWKDTLRWMRETQGFWELPAEMENKIIDYLSKNYPEKREKQKARDPGLPPGF